MMRHHPNSLHAITARVRDQRAKGKRRAARNAWLAAYALPIVATLSLGSIVGMAALNYTQGAQPSPDSLSITIWAEDSAFALWEESLSQGESTCLMEREGEAARYWLYSCSAPRYIAAD